MPLSFEWDPEKAWTNLRHHGITFEEAATVFGDPLSITIRDPDHSVLESRFLDIGHSKRGRLPVVSYTERRGSIRLINARRATRREKTSHEEKDN